MEGGIHQSLLVIEDSDEDFAALVRIMQKISFTSPIYRCSDGDEALDFIYQTGEYTGSNVDCPSVILLDLNLPGTDGREFIKEIKQDEQLKSIPIIVFTTSSNPKDIEVCYRYGVNSYMIKPIDIEKLKRTIEVFISYWFEVIVFPEVANMIPSEKKR